jgi:hypothetical protein
VYRKYKASAEMSAGGRVYTEDSGPEEVENVCVKGEEVNRGSEINSGKISPQPGKAVSLSLSLCPSVSISLSTFLLSTLSPPPTLPPPSSFYFIISNCI